MSQENVELARRAIALWNRGEIDAALDRIAAGTYGSCVHCGSAIPVERLQMRPFARACVTCASSR